MHIDPRPAMLCRTGVILYLILIGTYWKGGRRREATSAIAAAQLWSRYQCRKMLRIISSIKPTPHATVEVTDQLRICSFVSLKPIRLFTTQK